jgi:tRNA-binding EMAP/Myf-like protein
MKLTLKWLQRHIKFHETDLRKLLYEIEVECIKHGMELDGIQLINPILQVHVLKVEDIPGMKVRKCTVDLVPFEGLIDQPNTVLCGGLNAKCGMYTLMCPLNTTLHNGLKIVERKIKSEVSYGMLMSAAEANVDLPCADGCILDLTDRQSRVHSYEDVVLTLKVPFHRWDLHCVRGIARSLQSLGEFLSLRNTWISDFNWKIPVKNDTSVVMTFGEVHDIVVNEDVGIFMTRIGKESSRELQMLNDFVLLDIGHPIAIYDTRYTKEICVKYNNDNTIGIYNNQEMICEGGIRNIRGYEDDTKNVVIEAGYFHKEHINSLKTDSAYRFWLGIDNEQMTLEYVYNLVGGKKSSIYYGNGIMPLSKVIKLPLGDIYKYTGLSISGEHVIDILSVRKFVCKMSRVSRDESVNDLICVECQCPSWRKDIVLPIDIIEEITRSIGYESIHTNEDKVVISGVNIDSIEQLKMRLCYMGFNEIYKFPFTSRETAVKIQNPINSQESYMRNNLFYGMYENISGNNWSYKMFTYDSVYEKVGDSFVENKYLGILINGKSMRFWNKKSESYTFFDIKQVVESLGIRLTFVNDKLPEFAAYGLTYEEGYIVKVKNSIAEDTYFAQLRVKLGHERCALDVERVYNDVSIKCNKSLNWSKVQEILNGHEFYLFDVFECDDCIKYGITFVGTVPVDKIELLQKY